MQSQPTVTRSDSQNGTDHASTKADRKARKAANKLAKNSPAPKTSATPKQTFAGKLGCDLAKGLVKDPYSLSESFNLIDRVTFIKLPSPAVPELSKDPTYAAIEQEFSRLSPEPSISSGSSGSTESLASSSKIISHDKHSKNVREVFDLNDFNALASLQELIGLYGRVSHVGILDPSYTFYITKDRTAALYYKVKNKIAVVGGDPLCPPDLFPKIISEFEKFLAKQRLGIAFVGAGEEFVQYLQQQKWTTMCFATERVLNPMTNPVLHGNAGKSITQRIRTLVNPDKEGLTLEVYAPLLGKNSVLQQQLVNVYEEWRNHRDNSNGIQAYITVFDPFALPDLMTYIYTRDRTGHPNGFAALRILGSNKGYHLDPYVALPTAPKGVTDLLLYAAMSLLNTAKISYLSLGYEPLDDLGEISGMPKSMASVSRKVHKMIFNGLHVAGKKDYHDKFHPDEAQSSKLYLVFPPGRPTLRHMQAVVHVANIKMREVIYQGVAKKVERRKSEKGQREKSEEKKTRPMASSDGLFGRSMEKSNFPAISLPVKFHDLAHLQVPT